MLKEELKTILEKICSTIPPRYTEYVELNEASEHICGEDISAPTDIPHADRSLRDGIAYNSSTADISKPLKIMSHLSASQIYSARLEGNNCVMLSTGSYLPLGADTIIQIEDCSISDNCVMINKDAEYGKFIEKRGSQYAKGSIVITKDTLITHRHIEMLATLRINSINVVRMPRIGILSTGSEITDQFGEKSFIVNSNYHALSAFLKNKAVPHGYFGVVDDMRDEIKANITRALNAYDALVTFGGTAKGNFDLMGEIVEELAGEIIVSGMKATPGKTFRLAILNNKPVFLLPGTPSASLLCEELFLNTWILAYKGFDWQQCIITCKSGFNFTKRKGFGRFIPCSLHIDKGTLNAIPLKIPDMLDVIKGIAILDADTEEVKVGDQILFFLSGCDI